MKEWIHDVWELHPSETEEFLRFQALGHGDFLSFILLASLPTQPLTPEEILRVPEQSDNSVLGQILRISK